MGNVFSFEWEDKLIIFLQNHMNAFLEKLAGIITEFGDAMILTGIVGLFYWSLNKKLGRKLIINLSFINNIYPCIKSIVRRSRPYMTMVNVNALKAVNSEGDINDFVSQGYSFPSGHACNSIAVYGTVIKNNKNLVVRIVMAVLIALIGLSRIALGVHYPTDVLAGWVLSGICVWFYQFVESKIGRNKTFLLFDIVCIAGFFFANSNDFFTGYGMLIGATLGILFEEKYVNFAETKKPLAVILRTAGGIGIYLVLNTLMKMPFSEEFLNSATLASFSVRAVRYAITVFVLIGLYPMLFKLFNKKEDSSKEEK